MSRTRSRRPGPLHRDELEGFLEGLRHRVAGLPPERRREADRELEEGEARLRRGDLPGAETTLSSVEASLDAEREEPELSEFPRGLVGYVPIGDRGSPTPEDEEPVANRLRIVARLIDVRRASGRDVAAWIRGLEEARAAYAAGDRREARRRCDAVLREVEAEPEDRGGAER